MSIYIEQKSPTTHNSHVKQNREYLLSANTARDFNTYLSFDIFPTFSDITTESNLAKAMKNGGPLDYQVGTWGARSIFNKFGAVIIGGKQESANDNPDVLDAPEIRISHNAPLIDTPSNRERMRDVSRNCTIRDLVEDSANGVLGRATFSYSDFMYCKHLGKMPNNYLVTLRRFATPPPDYISNAGERPTRLIKTQTQPGSNESGRVDAQSGPPIGTLVTWMNTPGNNLEDILKYSVSLPWEEKTAQWENDGLDADNSDKPLNAIASMFDKTYREQYVAGYAGGAINKYVNKFFNIADDGPYKNMLSFRDSNKIYSPVNAIKKTYYPGQQGIDFDQTISLTFDYELRSYNGINGKAAMLDLISNILNVTYTTGDFWSGDYYAGGAHQNEMFANMNIFKVSGGFSDFWDAFTADATNIAKSVRDRYQKLSDEKGGVVNVIKSMVNNLGGMLVGGLLNKLGRPQKAAVNSLLSSAPFGQWHVMIGNPYHPIMSLGNMILKKTEITHYGPLGLDDFPTGLKVVCELERGKPRDLRGIEMIYMNGNDRIYSSMGDMVFDLYNHAKCYNHSEIRMTTADADAISSGATVEYREDPKTGKQVPVRQAGVPTGHTGRNVGDTSQLMVQMQTQTSGSLSTSVAADISGYQNDEGALKKAHDYNEGEGGEVSNYPSADDYNKMKQRTDRIMTKLGSVTDTLQHFFGTNDPYSISTAAREMEFGASKKRKSAESSGTVESGQNKNGAPAGTDGGGGKS